MAIRHIFVLNITNKEQNQHLPPLTQKFATSVPLGVVMATAKFSFLRNMLLGLIVPHFMLNAYYSPPPDLSGKDLEKRCDENIRKASEIKAALQQSMGEHSNQALYLYNEIGVILSPSLNEAGLLREVHPDASVRKEAENCEQKASQFFTELSLDNQIYQALLASDESSLDKEGQRMLKVTLRDFKRSGVDQDITTRLRIKELRDELVLLSQAFGENIRKNTFYIELKDKKELDGLPEDYITSHLDTDGVYRISTDYTDYTPFMEYAKNASARKELRFKYLNRGEGNGEVLKTLIKKRDELAHLLNYRSYAEYITEDKMIKNPEAVSRFIDQIADLAKEGADAEYNALLNFKREKDPSATGIEAHENAFLQEAYKNAHYQFNSQEVRPYFSYTLVRDGLLNLTSQLFGIYYVPVRDAKVWHDSVESYDVFDQTGKIGRIYLDMFPRENKYSHAAQFPVISGLSDRQYPEGALVCNFPNPADDGIALMEHSQVQTFFHEFGHLIHHIFAGKHQWLAFSGVATEWDFVEAPSQLLEEWAWSPEVLKTFARHYQTGEVIPLSVVQKMKAADEFGKALAARQQMFYASLSLNYYHLDPNSFDLMGLLKELQQRYSYTPYEEGTHFNYSFGHLDGYSAIYYTYMWSLSLAKDLFSPFKEYGLLNPDIAKHYRNTILAPGGSKDANTLVEDFLGRPFQFEAFEKWLSAPF